jgi:hypothetical protein
MEFELCLEEHEKEIKDFGEDQRPLFPEEGMTCPVPSCNTSHFRRYGQLLDHWIDVHVKIDDGYSNANHANIHSNQDRTYESKFAHPTEKTI